VAVVALLSGCGDAPPEAPARPSSTAPAAAGDSADQGRAGEAAAPPAAEDQRVLASNGGRWTIRWQPIDHELPPVNEAFSMQVEVLDAATGAFADVELIADGAMPHHRHGLVRRPEVTADGPGRFRVDGMLLHMPGRWELYFDVVDEGLVDRGQDELHLE